MEETKTKEQIKADIRGLLLDDAIIKTTAKYHAHLIKSNAEQNAHERIETVKELQRQQQGQEEKQSTETLKIRLNNDLEKQQGENFFDLWLPEETMRYVFRILAIKQIMTHPKTYGFILKEEDFSPSIQESIIEINTPINWVELAQKYGLTYAQLRASNVWIRDLTLTNRMNKTYRVNIPNKADFKYDCARIKVHDSNWIK